MTNFQPGQILTSKFGGKATVVKLSKDGKRVYVECWSGNHTPKLMRMWQSASAFVEGSK